MLSIVAGKVRAVEGLLIDLATCHAPRPCRPWRRSSPARSGLSRDCSSTWQRATPRGRVARGVDRRRQGRAVEGLLIDLATCHAPPPCRPWRRSSPARSGCRGTAHRPGNVPCPAAVSPVASIVAGKVGLSRDCSSTWQRAVPRGRVARGVDRRRQGPGCRGTAHRPGNVPCPAAVSPVASIVAGKVGLGNVRAVEGLLIDLATCHAPRPCGVASIVAGMSRAGLS